MASEPAEVCIGVLALQGAFREHLACLRKLPRVRAVEVRTKEQLAGVDGLIIPGGVLGSLVFSTFQLLGGCPPLCGCG